MGRLLIVELRRALSRGVTRILTPLGAVLIVVAGVLVFVFVEDPAAARAEAQAQYDRNLQSCVAATTRSFDGPVVPGKPPPPSASASGAQQACEERLAPQLERVIERSTFRLTILWPGWERDREFSNGFFDLLDAVIMLPALLLMLGGIVAGASMVGAEWQAGSFVTLLTWEPRRSRLLVARMIVTALLGFVIGLALLVLFTVVLLPTAAVKGGPAGPDGDWWVTYAGVLLRLGGLTGLAAATGAALAMIGKRTALAIFAVFGYLIAGELIIRNFWAASRPWMLLRNVSLVLGGEDLVPDGGSALSGVLVVAAYSGVMMVAALTLFGRRDFASAG
jgi:ABC-2 type transport system permease protein